MVGPAHQRLAHDTPVLSLWVQQSLECMIARGGRTSLHGLSSLWLLRLLHGGLRAILLRLLLLLWHALLWHSLLWPACGDGAVISACAGKGARAR